VIRGSGFSARVVPAEIVDARIEAERIVATARAEAVRLVEEARAEAERLREEARAEAERLREEARAAALAAARAEIAEGLVAAARAREAAIAGAEREVQTLALVAAGRIVGEELALSPERIVTIVRNVTERARRARGVEVRVHPDDAVALERAVGASLRIIPDPTITRGGCVVTSELGIVDARVEVQLDAMARILGCESP
jgi:flagellar biosynthesis/type III secretory pathway protein FliH